MSKFRVRLIATSLVVMFVLVSCNLPSFLSENEPALPPTATQVGKTNPVPTNKPVTGLTPSAVPDVSITRTQDLLLNDADFQKITQADSRIKDLVSFLNQQNANFRRDVTENTYSNGVTTRFYWFISVSALRAILTITSPSKKSNSFILDFSDKVVTLSDREGRLEMTTEKRAGQDVIHFSIYQGSTKIYDSLEMTTLDGGEIALCSARPQSLSGFWEWLKKCFGPRKFLANTVKCVAATTAVTVAYYRYKALETKTRLDNIAFAAVAATFMANCLTSANDCFFGELMDDPPKCELSGWGPSGKTTQIPWLNGRIQATIHRAKIICSDDKPGCCTYDPPSDWVEAPSGTKGSVKITDSGGNQVTLNYQAPQPSANELKTLITGLDNKTYIGQFSRSKPEVLTNWESCTKGVKVLTDTVQIFDNNTVDITGKASFSYQCNKTSSSYVRSFEMTFTGTKTSPALWNGDVWIITTNDGQNPTTTKKDWRADLKDNTLSVMIAYDRTTYRSWASGDLLLYKP